MRIDPDQEGTGAHGEWLDHLAAGVLPEGTPCRLVLWPFAPGYAHWLQAAWVSGSGRCSR